MKIFKIFYFLSLLFLTACATSHIKLAKEKLQKGMDKAQVESIMGMPDDVKEQFKGRYDWIYIGYAADDFRNIKLIFVNDKYAYWLPAGRNTYGEAAYDAAITESFRDTQRLIESNQRNFNDMNTNFQLNQINSNLQNINYNLRRY